MFCVSPVGFQTSRDGRADISGDFVGVIHYASSPIRVRNVEVLNLNSNQFAHCPAFVEVLRCIRARSIEIACAFMIKIE